MLCLSASPSHRFNHLKSDRLPDVEIVHVHHRGTPASWQLMPMVRISAVLAGRARIWSHGFGAVFGRGETIVTAPGCTPRILERLTETGETLNAYVAPHLFDAIAARVGGPCAPQLEVHLIALASLHELMHLLANGLRRGAEAPELRRRLELLIATTCVATRDPGTRTLPARPLRPEVGRTRRIIQDRFAQNVSLGELAKAVGLSKFHLLRVFRDQMGTTPHAYQLQLRIARAREMLDARASAAEVALACGFADQAHFTRAFKRIVGYTPGAFKRYA